MSTMDLDSLYQDVILDHSKRKLNSGLRDPFDAEVHHVNPTCGDELTLRVKLTDNPTGGKLVADISYDAVGCSISTASASVMTDLMIGRSLADDEVTLQEFLAMMRGKGQYEPDEEVLEDAVAFQGTARLSARVKCALLSWMAYQDAVTRAQEDS
jgi:nitrogen fixation protein NifU and related proteins